MNVQASSMISSSVKSGFSFEISIIKSSRQRRSDGESVFRISRRRRIIYKEPKLTNEAYGRSHHPYLPGEVIELFLLVEFRSCRIGKFVDRVEQQPRMGDTVRCNHFASVGCVFEGETYLWLSKACLYSLSKGRLFHLFLIDRFHWHSQNSL